MNYILFDGEYRDNLLPLTYTKPVADLRIGILTIREKWEKHLGFTTTTITEDYLSEKFPMVEMEENIMINASFLPSEDLVELVKNLKASEAIYIGKYAQVMEGSMIRGPFAMGAYSVVKMGTKVYGPTTLGPKCKIGGEVNNAILSGYCSKGHDGYLGNAVIGEWCNIGADSNNSNLKNNYANVKMWQYAAERFVDTGLQFCGLIMGDHTKCGINTMFNTGSVIGVSANIYGSNFPRNFIPSFSWGGAAGLKTYSLPKAFETMDLVMKRKNEEFNDEDRKIMEHIFELSAGFRSK